MHWRAIVRTGCIFERISRLFPGTSFVIPPDAAVTVAAAGGATPPEVKERGWFPWAASLGQRWPSDALALGLFCAHRDESKSRRLTQMNAD